MGERGWLDTLFIPKLSLAVLSSGLATGNGSESRVACSQFMFGFCSEPVGDLLSGIVTIDRLFDAHRKSCGRVQFESEEAIVGEIL